MAHTSRLSLRKQTRPHCANQFSLRLRRHASRRTADRAPEVASAARTPARRSSCVPLCRRRLRTNFGACFATRLTILRPPTRQTAQLASHRVRGARISNASCADCRWKISAHVAPQPVEADVCQSESKPPIPIRRPAHTQQTWLKGHGFAAVVTKDCFPAGAQERVIFNAASMPYPADA